MSSGRLKIAIRPVQVDLMAARMRVTLSLCANG